MQLWDSDQQAHYWFGRQSGQAQWETPRDSNDESDDTSPLQRLHFQRSTNVIHDDTLEEMSQEDRESDQRESVNRSLRDESTADGRYSFPGRQESIHISADYDGRVDDDDDDDNDEDDDDEDSNDDDDEHSSQSLGTMQTQGDILGFAYQQSRLKDNSLNDATFYLSK